jgi:hypothetical protein
MDIFFLILLYDLMLTGRNNLYVNAILVVTAG